MYLARVKGHVVLHKQVEELPPNALLIVQPISSQTLNENGDLHIAIDTVRAGIDDIVQCVGSREAALALAPIICAVDAAVVGIVDAVGDKILRRL